MKFPIAAISLALGLAPWAGACFIDTVLDFEGYPAGTVVTNQFAGAKGVEISCANQFGCMIFNSSNPTGGDWDLGSPNVKCGGGPGTGKGGEAGKVGENCLSHGNILILSEDGDASDPDDNMDGGTMSFAFTECVELVSISTLDNQGTEDVIVDVSKPCCIALEQIALLRLT